MKESMFKKLFKWEQGRQKTGYEKMLLLFNRFLLPFDCYLLRYKKGAFIPLHRDEVDGKRHFRLNIILKKAESGGELFLDFPIYESSRIKFFRPDRSEHSISEIKEGTRYVLSIGWALN